jgi:hypothetical protein
LGSSGGSLLGLLLLGRDLVFSGKQLYDFFILDGLVGLDNGGIEERVSDEGVTVLGDQDSGQELSNNSVFTFIDNVVRQDGLMLGTFDDTHASLAFVIQITEREGEATGLLLDFTENGTGSSHLELVAGVGLLVDGGTGFERTHLTFARGDEDIHTVDFVFGEFNTLKVLEVAFGGVENDL